MIHSEMLAQAGSNESQDSQAIFEAYRAEFGVGAIPSPGSEAAVLSSGTPAFTTALTEVPASHDALPEEAPRKGPALKVGDPSHWDMTGVALTHSQKQCASPDAGVPNGDVQDSVNRVDSIGSRTRSHQRPCKSSSLDVVEDSSSRHETTPSQPVQNDAPKPPIESVKQPPSAAAVALLRKMEFSQQTPTQVNDDRDYSEYVDIVPSSPVNGDTQSGSHEPRTLHDDDTGAVNFGNLSELGRPSSQISEDAGFENTRGDWRLPDGTSQLNPRQTPHRPHAAAFETPAVPKNPFAAKPTISAPLAGSQLFGQTQFSSAVKKISPTSSRPSPNVFNSISPNVMETSPLKNRANVSSPTDICTSSPQRLHDIPETSLEYKDGEAEGAATPVNTRSTGGDLIPESPPASDPTPRAVPPRSSGPTEPITYYEPMKKSQERKSSEGPIVSSMDTDCESDDAVRRMERRKKIERRRAKAAEEMGRVSFTPRITHEPGDQPLRKKRRVLSTTAIDAPREPPRPNAHNTKEQGLPAIVDDSQNGVTASNETLPVASTKATPRDSAAEIPRPDEDGDVVMVDVDNATVEEDMIPATSPAPSPADSPTPSPAPSLPPTEPTVYPPPSEPELPTLIADDGEVQEGTNAISEPSSLPPVRRRNLRTYGRKPRQKRKTPFLSSSNSDALRVETESKPTSVSSPLRKPEVVTIVEHKASPELASPKGTPEESEINVASHAKKTPRNRYADLPPPLTTRSRRSDTNPITPVASRSLAQILPTSSSLSILSTTPVPSDKTTPGTQDSPASDRLESITLPSPAGVRGPHKWELRTATKSESPQPATRPPRMARRPPRIDSESTDELHLSPAASVMEKSMIHTKSSRSFRQSLAPVHRTCRLFGGMVFAISFQNNAKHQERTKLETKITQAGGTILAEGFQEIFEDSLIMNTASPPFDERDALKLTKSGCESGFTALLADSHSRKAKYMQALALGLPCLAHQWATACLNKGGIVDWEPYMLCAGVSAVLGNAIRSRTLAPYCAAEARLVDVIEHRPRLLDGQRVLVVVDAKKSRNEAKEPYIFLATILGPSISRVFSTKQARDVLLEDQKAGNPFDWLYIDKGTGTVDAVLAPKEMTGNKRRRKSSPPHDKIENIRVLDDELVIQSLILGRMVEEDEMYT
ncbi:hypothetical protein FZEAL_538 [Fusarium zealandicum]|uniref:BRCT domain-containing protein n=1 Tax=Fusarium zealandicum TaxID=1053134 RepID=A0A8H4UUI9_9HYPO|nr:hypothetical protein FZEAL_538 [Fusarium zealandicum]